MPLSDAIDAAANAAKARAAQAEDILKGVPGRAADARKSLKRGVDQARGQLSDLDSDELNERISGARSYVIDRVQDRPVTATVAALGAGFLIGLMFAGNRR